MRESEFMEINTAQLVFLKSIYPRDHPNIDVISRYADAMSTGARFPPVAIAMIDGRYAIIDGVHRIKAMNLLSGFKDQPITAEFLGNLTDQEAFEESVKRNQGHGLHFGRDDLKKIVKILQDKGRELSYISGLLHVPELKLHFEPAGKISYPESQKEGKRKANAPLGMTLDELIGWTRKFIKKGGLSQESLDLLTQLRDEINDLLQKRREAEKRMKAEEAKGDSVANKEDDKKEEVPTPESFVEGKRESRRMVDARTFSAAIMKSFQGISEEEARKTALHVLSFFGFERTCLSNNLDESDNQVFYMLEDKGLLRAFTEESSIITEGKPWRISQYELVYEKIFEAADRTTLECSENIYEGLPQEAWVR